jgi:hypothetical protein
MKKTSQILLWTMACLLLGMSSPARSDDGDLPQVMKLAKADGLKAFIKSWQQGPRKDPDFAKEPAYAFVTFQAQESASDKVLSYVHWKKSVAGGLAEELEKSQLHILLHGKDGAGKQVYLVSSEDPQRFANLFQKDDPKREAYGWLEPVLPYLGVRHYVKDNDQHPQLEAEIHNVRASQFFDLKKPGHFAAMAEQCFPRRDGPLFAAVGAPGSQRACPNNIWISAAKSLEPFCLGEGRSADAPLLQDLLYQEDQMHLTSGEYTYILKLPAELGIGTLEIGEGRSPLEAVAAKN